MSLRQPSSDRKSLGLPRHSAKALVKTYRIGIEVTILRFTVGLRAAKLALTGARIQQPCIHRRPKQKLGRQGDSAPQGNIANIFRSDIASCTVRWLGQYCTDGKKAGLATSVEVPCAACGLFRLRRPCCEPGS